MKNTKKQNGITLIALIITIIVLLILAAVAIASVTDSGIITYAEKATEESERAKEEEQSKLAILETQLAALGTNLRLDTKYYESGRDVNRYYIFGSDGYLEEALIRDDGTEERVKIKYVVQDNMIRINELDVYKSLLGDEFDTYWESLPKEEQEFIEDTVYTLKIEKIAGNDLILLSSSGDKSLYATSEEGLRYFNGEVYVNGQERIVLNSDIIEMYLSGSTSRSGTIPVFYNGVIYYGIGGEQIITSTDNLETIVYKGKTFTKVTE